MASFQPGLSHGHLWRQVAQVPQDGGKRKPHHKKKYELGCLAANIKIGPSHMPTVHVQGDKKKFPALRLNVGNLSCGSECCMCKTQIVDVVYNASNNELVLTEILIKKLHCAHWQHTSLTVAHVPLGTALGHRDSWGDRDFKQKTSKKSWKICDKKVKNAKFSSLLEEHILQGKLLACIASRSGQHGCAED